MRNTIDLDYGLAAELIEEIKEDPMGDWFGLPDGTNPAELEKIKQVAKKVQDTSDYLVCIGIGGSYLGARAVYEALDKPSDETTKCKLLFAGNNLSSKELKKILKTIENHDFSLNIISKSGTTLEPAIAFRILKQALIKKYGAEEAKTRIIATTDPEHGALHDEAAQNDYETFDVPLGVGGRYSVLTAVGLFPLAVAGVDIDKLLEGARHCKDTQLNPENLKDSMLIEYAFARFYLYDECGCDVEVLAHFEPSLLYFNEWWKQLFGESEGKNRQGIFPASVVYSTDLHSLGQYMQDGRRNLFETFLKLSPEQSPLIVPAEKDSKDGLDYLEDKPLTEISDKALEATLKAHDSGGISTFVIEVLDAEAQTGLSELILGFLIFFFETACALSALLHGVDPFDQPGVEQYKKEMFKLLGKPNF
ncbi:glucose-6-phosphate isomerase [Candidatus Saccharibacteria bacterium]|nr:glucose-6-phosphate isomerase [Candidatus Saccharibacteria bacterium]